MKEGIGAARRGGGRAGGAGAGSRRSPNRCPEPEPVAGARAGRREPAPLTLPQARGRRGARVIALNMALNGSSREETARYLAENFELDDPEALLDEVYARVSG